MTGYGRASFLVRFPAPTDGTAKRLTPRLTAPRVSRLALETPSMSGKHGAMRVHLKGVHSVKMRLVDGRVAVYHYAWRGGPRLPGEPRAARCGEPVRQAEP